jgi:16S rRNA (adenine1518-N6/adenine1519-N6)-dimethyltransferase
MTHKARKRFGQNFLTDHSVISNILSCLQMHNGEHWVEIGPGQGALTKPLLEKAGTLDVVELDRDLVALLTKQFANAGNLHIHSADALQFDFSSLAKNNEKFRLIGNLPYNISTPLLFHLLDYPSCISDMHFMLQKEVVDRICADPNSKSYGRLSVMLQYYCEAEQLFDVPPECFDPVPKVTSAIIRLVPHAKPPVELASIENFKSLVAHAFSQRRKTIRNSLKKLMNDEVFIELGIDPSARAENLSLVDFARLSNHM